MMELRVRVTVAEHGRDPENGDAFLDGFVRTHAESDPVVSQNPADGSLTVAFSVKAEDVFAAGPVAGQVFQDGANASGLAPTEFLDISVSVTETELQDEDVRELQPA